MQSIVPPITFLKIDSWRVAGFEANPDAHVPYGKLTVEVLGEELGHAPRGSEALYETYELMVYDTPEGYEQSPGRGVTQTLTRNDPGRYRNKISKGGAVITNAFSALEAAARAVATGRADELLAIEAACISLGIVNL